MPDNQGPDDKLRDSEIAMIDALKLILEVMVASGTIKAEPLQRLLLQRRDNYIAKEMANAAVVMEVLRGFAVPPEPDAENEAHRRALEEPPKGSA